jgi:hypothetical protein
MMNEPSFTRGRKWRVGFNVVVGILSAFALIAMINYLSSRHSVRYNWVDSAGNKLSPMTERVLASITNKVKVIVFFPRNDAPLFGLVTGLLKDYQMRCPNIELEVVDHRFPGRSEKIRAEYNLTAGAGEGSRVIFDCAGRKRVVNRGELSDFSMDANKQIRRSAFKGEQLFTSALLTVTTARHVKAYFVVGHDEHGPENQDDSQGYSNFKDLFVESGIELGVVDYLHYKDVPEDCSLLIIAGPEKKYTKTELDRIDAYLKQGGRLFVAFKPCLDPKPVVTGVETLLANWNVDVGMNVVQDKTNEKANGDAEVIARNFGQHPIMRPLLRSSLDMIYPRSIASRAIGAVRADAPKATELVKTSERGVAARVVNKGVAELDQQGAIPIAIAVEKGGIQGVAADKGATRIVVVGSSMMFANAPLSWAGNYDFASVSINWLLNQDKFLTEIPPRAISEYTLSITNQQMRMLQWMFLGIAPTVAMLLGVIVWLKRRS